ncbi:helix-turn-helix domain-containing protein [Nocardia sp. CA-135398]|uniref:helix-turn-helix domain-containing protein n=1 Tax=Nocardia sp. CA-135398 TaxID=3239977 RepID=UPI003D952F86
MSEAITPKSAAIGGRGVLEGAFALLEVLAHGNEMGLTRLASAAELPKATAYRLLNQLVAEGAVQRRGGRYQIGPRVFRLGQTWQPARLLRAASARTLRQLTAASDRGGFSLAVTDRGNTMLIGGIGREIDEIFPLRPGVLLPPGTAAEQVLAFGHPNPTPPEGLSSREWRRRVDMSSGLAYDTDMSRFRLACVAAPVHGPAGEIVAALAATVAEVQRIPAVAEAVKRAAGLVSTDLTRLLRSHGVLTL